MTKKFYKNEKFQEVFYGCLIFILLCGFVASACYLFSRKYYEEIYVSGHSMYPTLLGGESQDNFRCHYGKADKSSRVINTLSRFDVVITYYPKDWIGNDETYIIKRVWGFPGEKISLTWEENTYTFKAVDTSGNVSTTFGRIDNENSYVYFTTPSDVRVEKTFRTAIKYGTKFEKRSFIDLQLNSDEYFVMGDNWPGSTDCYGHRSDNIYVSRNHIQGKVVQIEGTARYDVASQSLVEKVPIKGMVNF